MMHSGEQGYLHRQVDAASRRVIVVNTDQKTHITAGCRVYTNGRGPVEYTDNMVRFITLNAHLPLSRLEKKDLGLRAIAWIAAAAFMLSMVPFESLAPATVGDHDDAVEEAAHHGPCPDETPDGAPCSEGCACLCCPGHARTLLPDGLASIDRPYSGQGGLLNYSDGLNPQDLIFRIFHPPRAV